MKRQLLILAAFAALLMCVPIQSVEARHGFGRGAGVGRALTGRGVHHGRPGFGGGFGGFGSGFGFGGLFFDGGGISDLYRQLYNNLPYFALHPPVYYSYPVPRTYGYSPFAYPPGVMTPDILGVVEPLEIINPYVPSTTTQPVPPKEDQQAAISRQPQPLVIYNPYVTGDKSLAHSNQ